MAFYRNMITVYVVLVLGALCEAELGLHPDMTADSVKAMFADKEILARSKNCAQNGTDCTPTMQSALDVFPEVYTTACANCDERERQVFIAGSRLCLIEDPVFFKRLVEKFDKEGAYYTAYMKFVFPEN